jgi:uncharacterized membrane-anchored protein
MKINLKELKYNILDSLRDLGNNKNFLKFDMKQARSLLQTIKIIEKEYNEFEELQNKIVESSGERDKENNLIFQENNGLKSVIIKKDKIKETKQKIEEAKDKEFEINFEPISYKFIEEKGIKISNVEYLEALDGIFIIDK